MAMRIAVCQLNVPLEPDSGTASERALNATRDAFAGGADLVVLPELTVAGYSIDAAYLAVHAETIPGHSTDAFASLARDARGLVVLGLTEYKGNDLFNSAVLISGDGVIGYYRKLHLFAEEKRVFRPGDLGLPVVDTQFGRIGLCICYDLRFPEVARVLALRGADVICAPSAWVRGFDRAPANVPGQVQGVAVQANLNQVFVACASHVGVTKDFEFLGCSVVADPYGELVLGPLPSDAPATAFVDIDVARCAEARRRSDLITPRDDRRTDVYSLMYEGETL